MKAIVLETIGSLDGLKYVENRPVPNPQNGEIRVKVSAAGLNPVDYKLTLGWGDVNWSSPPVLGLDVAGIVDSIGEGVTKFSVGDRVYYHGNLSKVNGGFAEYACTDENSVSLMPEDLSMLAAASLPCSGFTAYQAVVKKLRAERGKTILIHAGAGGVGGYSIQLAKMRGLTVFTTCSTKNIDYVKELGADFALDYTKDDIYVKIMTETQSRGVDYIVNTLDRESATKDIDILAFHGELAAIVEHPDFSRIRFYEKAMSIHEVALGGAHLNGDLQAKRQLAEIGDEFAKLVVMKKIKPLSIKKIELHEVPQCLAELERRHVAGKMVALINDAE
ncbi:zinc-binding dehydrogenase [Sinanaerobacter chloroacetimidivorans]|uniref:Zinc-binding dehydrogenase n=1 Tax=Sinanaerobacter chloroacetimidivorans TaxID=2818044 RepID=A0A8J7W250_9FIRM|nr:zinc-binding dehydrogenase [Sinanaerobacter chloroacetimidivorans]MBR0597855.1 zinc-binding dehydrogenase [Sinanaerobacter chloroacetimidivorans]